MTAPAQESPAPNAPSYLMRMERMLAREDICVLVRGDGQYHFERELQDSTDVFEGTLALPDLQNLERIVNGDEISHLSQNKINAPLIGFPDEFFLSVARPGHWQDLHFPTPDTRKPFQASLDPLLEWLRDLPKEKHVTLTEDAGKNNCLPPGKIEFHQRPSVSSSQPAPKPADAPPTTKVPPAAAPKPPDFALRMTLNRFKDRRMEKSCLIVYPTGHYHREQKTQEIGNSRVTTQIFEESLTPDELFQLRQILDDPKLQKTRSAKMLSEIVAQEMEYVALTVPRNGQYQNQDFWRYFGASRIGAGGMPNVEDNGMKLLKPLNQWLKVNIEDQKLAPLADATPNNCSPAAKP